MKAAKFYLFVVLLYTVLNQRCADGGVHRRSLISFLNPVTTIMGIVKEGIGIAQQLKNLFSSPTYEIDDLMGQMVVLSHSMETMEQNLGAQMTNGFENLQQQFRTQAELSNHLLAQLQAEALMSYQMMQQLLTQAKLSDHVLQQLLAQARLSHRLLQQLHAQSELSDHLQDLNDQIGKISRKFRLLKQYANGITTYENYTLNEFATTCISSDGDGVPETLEKLHSLITPDRDGFRTYNLLKPIVDDLKEKLNTTHCNDKQSHQSLLYGLLDLIVITEIKGLALMQFSYMFLRLYGHGNFTSESQSIEARYETRLDETLDAFRTAMSIASPDLWRCDPPNWIEKDTYTKLGSGVNFVGLREVIADVESNKVITGIRFVNIENVIYLQIEQGELLSDGMIRANTTGWVNPGDTTEWNYPDAFDSYHRTEDYVFWDSLDKGIELNDVVAPPGHCLTGVKFTGERSGVLKLEIMTTPFDFATGRLIDPLRSSSWYRNDDTTPTTSLQLKDPTSSTLPTSQSIPHFGTNQRVPLHLIDTDVDYEKWHAVPLIDIQPVLPSPRVALGGAGIFYKGKDESVGFFAPKLITYNFTDHLHTDKSISHS